MLLNSSEQETSFIMKKIRASVIVSEDDKKIISALMENKLLLNDKIIISLTDLQYAIREERSNILSKLLVIASDCDM